MNILIVSYSYHPSLTPRAFRWTEIAEHWSQLGHNVHVLCESHPRVDGDESINGVLAYRVGRSPSARLVKSALPTGGGWLTGDNLKRLLSKGISAKATRYVWHKLRWPDYACFWYWPSRKKAEAPQIENNYDVMYSSSIPFTDHLVALAIKKRHPSLKWVADIGDPFCFSDGIPVNNFALYDRLNQFSEGQVFLLADAISVTTGSTKNRYSVIFPAAAAKITVIPPLLSVAFGEDRQGYDRVQQCSSIRMVFLGTLYKSIRDPDNLLTFFSKLVESKAGSDVELHFYGDTNACAESFLSFGHLVGKRIFIHGLVERSVAAQAIQQSDILVNIGNDTEYQLPSKVVEYLAAMKPILNFAKTRTDSSAAFFSSYDGVFCLFANETDKPEHFEAAVNFVCFPPKIDCAARRSQLSEFRIHEIAGLYLRLPYQNEPHTAI